jgi:tetratricopeptide (TPR) repeat protein
MLAGLSAGCAHTPQQKALEDAAIVRQETTAPRLIERGDAAASIGDLTRAEQYYVTAIKAGGDERVLTQKLLLVCVQDGRYPAAASYGEDYLRRHPDNTDIRYVVATIYIGLGELDRARRALEQVVSEQPSIAEAHYALGTVLRSQGDSLLDADRELREYIRLRPDGEYVEAARASLLKSVAVP